MNIEFRKRKKSHKHIANHITILRKEAVGDLNISNSMMYQL